MLLYQQYNNRTLFIQYINKDWLIAWLIDKTWNQPILLLIHAICFFSHSKLNSAFPEWSGWGPHLHAFVPYFKMTLAKKKCCWKEKGLLSAQIKKPSRKTSRKIYNIYRGTHFLRQIQHYFKRNLSLVCLHFAVGYHLILRCISSKEQSKNKRRCHVNLHIQTVFVGISKQVWALKRNKRLWEAGNEKKKSRPA